MSEDNNGLGGLAHVFGFGEHPAVRDGDVTRENFGDKMKAAMWQMCFGGILVVGALALAGWNEYRAVATEKTLQAAETSYVAAACSPIDPANDGKLVYVSCPVSGQKAFNSDAPFLKGTTMSPALRIVADVEIYQWHETQSTTTDSDGNSRTTYSYDTRWKSYYSRGGFTNCRDSKYDGCHNDDPRQESTWDSRLSLGRSTVARAPVQVGDFHLADYHLDQLGHAVDVTVSCGSLLQGSEEAPVGSGGSSACPPSHKVSGSTLYWSTGGEPMDGSGMNVRVSYSTYAVDEATVLAQQTNKGSFEKWIGPYDDDYSVDKIRDGRVSLETIIQDARDTNFALTWILRVTTFFMVWGGLQMVTAPLCLVGDLVPVIGPMLHRLFGCLLAFFNFLLGSFLWCIVVGSTWIAYRPEIGGPLLAAAFLCAFLAIAWRCVKKKRHAEEDEENPPKPSVTQAEPEGHGGNHFSDMVAKFQQQLQQANPQAAAALAPALAAIGLTPQAQAPPPAAGPPGMNCRFCGNMKDMMPKCPSCGQISPRSRSIVPRL